jgi:hypothetical protein
MRNIFSSFLTLFVLPAVATAFVVQRPSQIRTCSVQNKNPSRALSNSREGKVEVGSKEYLEGFISSPLQDESAAERGTGLEQALKLAGGFTVVLGALFIGFMLSNGLL